MISFVTVNFNNAQATLGLLRSLERQDDPHFDIIVVDNASRPSERAALGEHAAMSRLHLELIMSDVNKGFSGGNNLAIRKLLEQGSDWIILINNDTAVEPDFVSKLRPQLDRNSGIIGIPLREGQHTAYAGIVSWLKPTLRHVYDIETRDTLMRRTEKLYAIGAAVAVHRSVFGCIGLLDERYFLYFEDADFSVRAHRAGLPVRFADEPVVTHAVSQSTSRLGPPLLLRYHARNALLFNRLHGPWWVRLLLPFSAFYGMFLQFTKIMLMPSRRAASRAIRDGILDYYAHRFGQIPVEHHDDRHRV